MSWAFMGSDEEVLIVQKKPLSPVTAFVYFGGPEMKKCEPNAMPGVEEYGSCDGQTNSLILVCASVRLFVVVAVTFVGSSHQLPCVFATPWTFTSKGVQV